MKFQILPLILAMGAVTYASRALPAFLIDKFMLSGLNDKGHGLEADVFIRDGQGVEVAAGIGDDVPIHRKHSFCYLLALEAR